MAARYFAELQPDPELVDAYVAMVRMVKLYTSLANTAPPPARSAYKAAAAEARAAYQGMVRDYEQLARRGADKADEFVRTRIRQTAVRPPTTGRMAAAIHSEPLKLPFAGGGVGIANLKILDKGAVNKGAKKAGEYWRAQEYGTDAHVGRIVPGFFMPGQSKPSAAEFRNHPYFQQAKRGKGGKAKKGTPAMRITRPIRARHFLEKGTVAFVAWHERESIRINQRAISRLP